VLDTDVEFVDGSGIEITSLTKVQTVNLALLGRVWGFLKYHHPAVTSGQHHWDFQLFRILPDILEATDEVQAQAKLTEWIDSLGPLEPCEPCAEPDPARSGFQHRMAV